MARRDLGRMNARKFLLAGILFRCCWKRGACPKLRPRGPDWFVFPPLEDKTHPGAANSDPVHPTGGHTSRHSQGRRMNTEYISLKVM